MREIKFRQYIWENDSKTKGRMIEWEELLQENEESLASNFTNQFSNASELMQYTGLLDKNGAEIWEGDVVIANLKYFDIKDEKCKIIYRGGAFGVQYGYFDGYFKTISAWDSLEVIGNIHDEQVKP